MASFVLDLSAISVATVARPENHSLTHCAVIHSSRVFFQPSDGSSRGNRLLPSEPLTATLGEQIMSRPEDLGYVDVGIEQGVETRPPLGAVIIFAPITTLLYQRRQ